MFTDGQSKLAISNYRDCEIATAIIAHLEQVNSILVPEINEQLVLHGEWDQRQTCSEVNCLLLT